MRTVFFLGAGASYDAGYPLASEVIKEIEEYARTKKKSYPFSEYWGKFISLKKIKGKLKIILDSQDPELILTIPDLMKFARYRVESRCCRNYWEECNIRQPKDYQEAQSIWDEIISPYRKKLDSLRPLEDAADAFEHMLNQYFLYKHHEDSLEEGKSRYSYLNKAFSKLETGDVVISTNWDTLAERVLMNEKKWYPWDGYGFKIKMEVEDIGGRRVGVKPNLDDIFKKESEVKVLKLHGSIGWKYDDISASKKEVHLDSVFLHSLRPPECEEVKIKDENLGTIGNNQSRILIRPSYIKNLDDPNLQSIWYQAGEALRVAEKVFFVGYSLPSADVAIRALLNSLRYRIEKEFLNVTAIIGCKSDKFEEVWKDFLGEDIDIQKMDATSYFSNES